ncbi:guanine-N7--methyltransferase subunit Trm82 [Coprinopsis sp. MPI-PUGE-AT-0042]|nr:guanine-N7--methyltransferase subunit Trm82 [Coprinopsis sp. MPI-PUGE-AT-0042]
MAAEPSSSWPLTRLFYGSEKTVVTTGPHIQILDSQTGLVLRSTAALSEEQQQDVVKSGPIQVVAVDRSFRYVAAVGDDKLLKIWDTEDSEGVQAGGLKLLNSRELPKKATGILFTQNSQTILVSDKFGDVFSYPLIYVPFTSAELEQQKVDDAKDPHASHTNPSNGTLILGHVSPLNAMLLSRNDERFILTADRDEHIRVSWYPQGYMIEMFCLGHTKFVSALHIPLSEPAALISGGGDPVLKIWDWMNGKLQRDVPISDVIEPFIVVKRSKSREGEGENEGEEAAGKKGKKRKGKAAAKGGTDAEAKTEKEDADAMAVDEEPKPEEPVAQAEPEKVLAVRRIESVEQDGKLFYIFSAIGATALFSFPASDASSISHFDLGIPIIDFQTIPSPDDVPVILVLLDPSWNGGNTTSNRVRLLTLSSGAFTEASGETQSRYASLLAALNGDATRIAASSEGLKSLDLYSELSSLPKYVSRGPEIKPVGETSEAHSSEGAALTRREIGRQKRIARVEEIKTKALAKGDSAAQSEEQEDQPQLKRSKSENPNEASS